MSFRWKLLLRAILLLLLAGNLVAINGCEALAPAESPPPGPLRVVALRDPLSRLRPGEGLEYDLLWHFAESRGSRLVWKWAKTPDEALRALAEGKADLAAGRWSSRFFESDAGPLRTTAYEESAAALVCDRALRSQTEHSFLERLWITRAARNSNPDGTPPWIEQRPLQILISPREGERLTREVGRVNDRWRVTAQKNSMLGMVTKIENGKADCLVTDASSAQWLVNLHPTLRVTRDLPHRLAKVFVFAPGLHDLEIHFTSWFQSRNRAGFVSQIRERYFGFQKALNDADRRGLARAKIVQLPDLMPKFRKLAEEFRIPWQLIAAVAYQESHWNNEAESHTGVRGIMQLTRETARHLGVEDREDLDQSLWGGAKYLRALVDQQPARLHPRERLALALAAYNVGPAHLIDAQKLAVARGRSPLSFWDLRLVLPMLSDPAIAAELKYGLARGDEPVQFTDRVLAFYDLLTE